MKNYLSILLAFILTASIGLGIFFGFKYKDKVKDYFSNSSSSLEDSSASSEDTSLDSGSSGSSVDSGSSSQPGEVVDYEEKYNELLSSYHGLTVTDYKENYAINFNGCVIFNGMETGFESTVEIPDIEEQYNEYLNYEDISLCMKKDITVRYFDTISTFYYNDLIGMKGEYSFHITFVDQTTNDGWGNTHYSVEVVDTYVTLTITFTSGSES